MSTEPELKEQTVPPAPAQLVAIRDLTIALRPRHGQGRQLVSGVNLAIAPGEIHAIVGESGSGKTLLGRAVLGLLPAGIAIESGQIEFEGRDLARASAAQLRAVRGGAIGMVFQEPMVSLNPCMRIGDQMAEAMRIHTRLGSAEITRQSIEMLERIRMRNPREALRAYPHEFSGGMRQRIMLASVLMMRPRLLIADEPTTALDALIQKEVLDIMTDITREFGTAVALITHDLALVGQYAHAVSVMERGKVVEQGRLAQVFGAPRQAYTRALLAAVPGASRTPAAAAKTLLEVRDLQVVYEGARSWPWSPRRAHAAVRGVSFSIAEGETLALVGESGSGKTTVGRALLRLRPVRAGSVSLMGEDVLGASRARMLALRRSMQIIFQDPASSLDPRMRVCELIGEGLRLVPGIDGAERASRIARTLSEVGLSEEHARRFPHALSGGQRQRISIGRAIISRPRLIVADEPVSALDVTIQAQIIRLLKSLQETHGFTFLFISHDMGVVEEIADRVAVMYHGRLVEIAPNAAFFGAARHPYSRKLLSASFGLTGNPESGYRISQRALAEHTPPAGYRYFDNDGEPVMVAVGPSHLVACVPA